MTVNEVSKISGVSVRTLHYYDEIGLLRPKSIAENGYRQYDEESVARLQRIMLFRELEFPLAVRLKTQLNALTGVLEPVKDAFPA